MKDYTQDAFEGMWADMKAPKKMVLPKVKYQSNLNKEKMRLAQLKAQIKTKEIQAQINKMNAEQNARRMASLRVHGNRLSTSVMKTGSGLAKASRAGIDKIKNRKHITIFEVKPKTEKIYLRGKIV